MCVETLRTGLIFPRQLIWGVTCLGFLEKWSFSHLSPLKHHKCVLKPSTQGLFFWDNQFEGSHASVYSKNECFPIYLLRNARNVCCNHQNRVHFSESIDLRGHMPRFTRKWMFSHLSPLKHYKCMLKPSEKSSFFWDDWFEGHMPRFTWKMYVFPSISLETSEMCVETIRIELVFLRRLIWGVTCLGLLENECFPIHLLSNPINVCWNPQNRTHFS